MSGKSTVGVTRFGLAPARQVSPGFKPGPIKPEVSDADAFVAALEEVIRMLGYPFGGATPPMSQSNRPKIKRTRCAEGNTAGDERVYSEVNLEVNRELNSRVPRRAASRSLPLTLRTPSQPPPPTRGPGESPLPLEGALKRWFDEEVETLQRLAHTQRLKGDYVAAQTMEREIRQLTRQTAAVLERGHSGGR